MRSKPGGGGGDREIGSMSESDKTIELVANLMVMANEKGKVRQFDAALPTHEGGTLTVGRDRRNNLTIHDDYVSSKHLRILFKRGKHWLEDLKSTHGTQINNEPVTKVTPLKPGDAISIGKSFLQYNLSQRERVDQALPESITNPQATQDVTVGPTLEDSPNEQQEADVRATDGGSALGDSGNVAGQTDPRSGSLPEAGDAGRTGQVRPHRGGNIAGGAGGETGGGARLMGLAIILAVLGLVCYLAWQLFFDTQT